MLTQPIVKQKQGADRHGQLLPIFIEVIDGIVEELSGKIP